MSQFINHRDKAIAKDAEINQLKAQVRKLQADINLAENSALVAQNIAAELNEDCPECDDIAALEHVLCDAEYDVLTIQKTIGDELKIGAYWYNKLCAKGLQKEAVLLLEMMQGQMCEREYELAIAAHNVAFCKAKDVPDYIAEKKDELAVLVAANPDMDARCKQYIDEILLKACA